MTTTYPWNSVRVEPQVREVIIERERKVPMNNTGALAREIMCAKKDTDQKLHAIMHQQKCSTHKLLMAQKCAEKKLRKKLRDIEFLEIIRNRNNGYGHGRGGIDDAALFLLADDDDGDDNSFLLAALLDREGGGRRHHDHHDHEGRDLARVLGRMDRRLDRLSNNVTQLDTLLGVRPINPAVST